jgi:menaquinone-dependent protoporphyrinogen oxidase
MSSVLVAYATVYGSTKEVAEKVAQTLAEKGHDVTVSAAGDAKSVQGYDGVVVGTALYFFRAHKDFRKFFPRHRTELQSTPVAVFGLGPFEDKDEDFEGARGHLMKTVDKNAWLEPVAVEVFGGAFDPEGLRFPHSNPAMKSMPASDIRDWDAIAAWAESLPSAMGLP